LAIVTRRGAGKFEYFESFVDVEKDKEKPEDWDDEPHG